jgi:hypothetical protein
MAKFFTVDKEIGGEKYTFQFNGVLAAVKATDETYIDGTDIRSSEKWIKYLLENVVVSPKKEMDDFESIAELNEVVAFANEVMNGEHNPNTKPKKSAE